MDRPARFEDAQKRLEDGRSDVAQARQDFDSQGTSVDGSAGLPCTMNEPARASAPGIDDSWGGSSTRKNVQTLIHQLGFGMIT
jgi:hypothetical protein